MDNLRPCCCGSGAFSAVLVLFSHQSATRGDTVQLSLVSTSQLCATDKHGSEETLSSVLYSILFAPLRWQAHS